MCRSLLVLCVAEDATTLAALTRSVVAAEWELGAGATDPDAALEALEAERPHVLVLWGAWGALAREARGRHPSVRIVADRALPEADAVASALGQLRDTVRAVARPVGPVR